VEWLGDEHAQQEVRSSSVGGREGRFFRARNRVTCDGPGESAWATWAGCEPGGANRRGPAERVPVGGRRGGGAAAGDGYDRGRRGESARVTWAGREAGGAIEAVPRNESQWAGDVVEAPRLVDGDVRGGQANLRGRRGRDARRVGRIRASGDARHGRGVSFGRTDALYFS
jgi:hypothetical protein